MFGEFFIMFQDLGLNIVWDDELSYIFILVFVVYELEYSMGVFVGNEEF